MHIKRNKQKQRKPPESVLTAFWTQERKISKTRQKRETGANLNHTEHFSLYCWNYYRKLPLRSAAVNPAALPLPYGRSLCSPFAGSKARGWLPCFAWRYRLCRKREQLKRNFPTTFSFVQHTTQTLHWKYKTEVFMGIARPQTLRPPLRTVDGFAL